MRIRMTSQHVSQCSRKADTDAKQSEACALASLDCLDIPVWYRFFQLGRYPLHPVFLFPFLLRSGQRDSSTVYKEPADPFSPRQTHMKRRLFPPLKQTGKAVGIEPSKYPPGGGRRCESGKRVTAKAPPQDAFTNIAFCNAQFQQQVLTLVIPCKSTLQYPPPRTCASVMGMILILLSSVFRRTAVSSFLALYTFRVQRRVAYRCAYWLNLWGYMPHFAVWIRTESCFPVAQ